MAIATIERDPARDAGASDLRFRLLQEVCGTPEASFWRALDRRSGKPCMVRVIDADREQSSRRLGDLHRERTLAERIGHAGVLRTDVPLIESERIFQLVEPEPARAVAIDGEGGRLAVLNLLVAAAATLADAHSRGVFHGAFSRASCLRGGDGRLLLQGFTGDAASAAAARDGIAADHRAFLEFATEMLGQTGGAPPRLRGYFARHLAGDAAKASVNAMAELGADLRESLEDTFPWPLAALAPASDAAPVPALPIPVPAAPPVDGGATAAAVAGESPGPAATPPAALAPTVASSPTTAPAPTPVPAPMPTAASTPTPAPTRATIQRRPAAPRPAAVPAPAETRSPQPPVAAPPAAVPRPVRAFAKVGVTPSPPPAAVAHPEAEAPPARLGPRFAPTPRAAAAVVTPAEDETPDSLAWRRWLAGLGVLLAIAALAQYAGRGRSAADSRIASSAATVAVPAGAARRPAAAVVAPLPAPTALAGPAGGPAAGATTSTPPAARRAPTSTAMSSSTARRPTPSVSTGSADGVQARAPPARDAGGVSVAASAAAEVTSPTQAVRSRVATLVAGGNRALTALEPGAAAEAFATALALAPDDRAAIEGSQRARRLQGVAALMRDAREATARGDHGRAVQGYSQALSNDPRNRGLAEALATARRNVGRDATSALLAEGHEALGAGRLEQARAAFARVLAVDPLAPGAQRAAAQAATAIQLRDAAEARRATSTTLAGQR